ncbi:MAG: histidine kinase [Luteolibacter sp.]|uniref:histidine kinase n=1 Tax=Luteolibacter sp. TaxID=1962973 RepID=UPI00326503AF
MAFKNPLHAESELQNAVVAVRPPGVSGWLCSMSRGIPWIAMGVAFAMMYRQVRAAEPYTVDEHTLHLWHLDEGAPPFADSGLSPKPLLGLLNGAAAGVPSLPGMVSAVSFNHHTGGNPLTADYAGALLHAMPKSADGPEDDVTPPFPIAGSEGAFTIEALVRFEVLPTDAPGVANDIVSMDGEGDTRVFNFRIEKPGFLSFIPFSGHTVRGGGLAAIPLTGPNAINTEDWFHVAVSYDGNEGTPGNLKLYWTKVAPGLKSACLLGSGTLASDLSTNLGDFVIGNTGRTIYGHRECNPFPGVIDEVRISGIAREPADFFFVSPEARNLAAGKKGRDVSKPQDFQLRLNRVLVDGVPQTIPNSGPLTIRPGLHRIDVDYGFPPGTPVETLAVNCLLGGFEDSWRPAARGMVLICETLDVGGEVVSSVSFPAVGQSQGWEGDPNESRLGARLEPLFVPSGAKSLRITLSSGAPDSTGQFIIGNLSVNLASQPAGSLWPNGDFNEGVLLDTMSGVPTGWKRAGDDPAIARVVQRNEGKALGLVDGNQEASASWTAVAALPSLPAGGATVLLSWKESYNVIGGNSYRATYQNVPPGEYKFRAIAVTGKPKPGAADMELAVTVRRPIWEMPWFSPAAAAVLMGLTGLVILQAYRRRSLVRLSKLRLQHTLERDRTRIAMDLHDDLGTRVSSLIMSVSLLDRDYERDSEAARRHLLRLGSSSRELVGAMEELVWAVDPANDSLDQLASHLTGLAQEMFRDTGVRLRIDVPTGFPPGQLRSDFRHHFSLAVKESLHNVLKHAGPCALHFEIRTDAGEVIAIVRDDGRGFDAARPAEGNGLLNLHSRLAELGGSCHVESTPGRGTVVTLCCPVRNLSNTKIER